MVATAKTTEDCTALGGCDWSPPWLERCRAGHWHTVRVCHCCLVDVVNSCQEADLAVTAVASPQVAADAGGGGAA